MYQFGIKKLDKSPEMKTLIDIMFSAVYGTTKPGKLLQEEWYYKNVKEGQPSSRLTFFYVDIKFI